jgi:hypothetical protein
VLKHIQQQLKGLGIHHLTAIRAGGDMAMETTLITAIAQVDLKRIQRPAPDGGKGGGKKVGGGIEHGIILVTETGIPYNSEPA